jgi:hypothetical protein
VDEPGTTTNVAPKPDVRVTDSRLPRIFAIAGIVVALVAASLYLFTRADAPPRLTPEETVREFLSAVFLSGDRQRVAAVVCASWDPADAITRTTREIQEGAHVSWDNVIIITSSADRASATARLGLRLRDDTQPSLHRQWRFNLVDQNGWRVCDARPVT